MYLVTFEHSVIISDQFGSSLADISPEGGRIIWLENPGNSTDAWKMHTIGRSPGMHRLKAGNFTRQDRLQIVAVPIIVKSNDFSTPAPIIIFTSPEDSSTAWTSEKFAESHIPHEVATVSAEVGGTRFDQIVLASRDGIDVHWFDEGWKHFKVGTGIEENSTDPLWRATSVSVGRVDNDYAGYISSSEVHFLSLEDPSISNS